MMIPLPHGLGQLHRRNWIVVASWPGTAWWYGTESLCIPNRHDTGSTSPRSVGEVALVPGERGVLLCVALDQRVAKIILDYAEASFERSPILKQLIASRTADALELTNGITLEVRPASFRKLRGPTHVAVIADERVIVERHRVDQPTISGRSRANLGHYKPLFACDDCTFSSGRRCAFFTGESTSRFSSMARFA